MMDYRNKHSAPPAAAAFTVGMTATALLRRMGASDRLGIGVLALIAAAAAIYARPVGSLAVAAAPALFADHFFVAPYTTVNFTPRDLLVLLAIPIGALALSSAFCTYASARAALRSRRLRQLSTFDGWLLSLPHHAHPSAEGHSVG